MLFSVDKVMTYFGTLVNVRLTNVDRLTQCPRFECETRFLIFHSLISKLGESQSRLWESAGVMKV